MILTKQKYSYTQGFDWSKCVQLSNFYRESGIEYTLFGFIKWKKIKNKIGKK